MLKAFLVTVVTLLFIATAALATPNVSVGVSTPGVNVQVGTQAPQPRIIERERVVVVKEKSDNGKHKGHYKHKKHKKHKD